MSSLTTGGQQITKCNISLAAAVVPMLGGGAGGGTLLVHVVLTSIIF